MGIASTHPDYDEYKDLWEYCETFYEGSAAVKKRGSKLLPVLSGQSPEKYKAYKDRALVPGFVPRTVAALVGAIFRREPHFALPTKLEYLRRDCTGTGVSLAAMAVKITAQVMITGRAILMVDRSVDGSGKPYIVCYDADDLTNWSLNTDNTFYVLEDSRYITNPDDKFDLKKQDGYRELTLDEDGEYVVNVWIEQGSNPVNQKYIIESTFKPTKAGRGFKYVPIVCVNPYAIDFEVSKPPILELCEIAHASYCTSADWMNALHVAASPTPMVYADIQADEFTLNLGPDSVTVLPAGSKAEFLESKTELGALENAMTKLEHMAAILGARLLDTGSSSMMDTATSAMIKESASTAVLSSVISSVEAAMYKCLEWIADWEFSDTNGMEVALNKELVQSRVDANMLNALVAAYQSGSISLETFYHNLQEGGLTQPGISAEEEYTRVKEKAALDAMQQQPID